MPTYNRSQMVQRAVASVLAQDYPHFELLIVDDCSSDDTWEVLNRLYGLPGGTPSGTFTR